MANILYPLAVALAVLIVAYIANTIWEDIAHAKRARQWGCEPAFIRPYKYPLGIDILLRYLRVGKTNDVQNDDLVLYEELGRRNTWYQNILGSWHHVTSDPKNIQAMLATQFQDYSLGPVRRGAMGPLLGAGIFTVDGREWEHSRALLRPQFTRRQVSDLELEESHVQNLFEQMRFGDDGWTNDLDLSPLFFKLTLDTSTEFLFGESVYSQKVQSNKDATLTGPGISQWSSFEHHFDQANLGVLTRFRFFDLYFLYNPKSFRDHCKEVHRCVDHFVDLAIAARVDEQKQRPESYVFLHELAKVTTDRLELRSQILNILLAGRDTTAGLLGFTFYFLARHDDVYQKLRKAILDDFGTGTEPITFESLKACTYLQDVMSEVLRIEPVVPENARRSVKNTTLPRGGGPNGESPVYIRAGQEIVYNTRIMHRREDIWGPDATEFKPDRWRKYRAGWEYLPFNGGPRICLGQQFALTTAGYVIVRMLQKFDKIENLDRKPMKHRFTQTTAPMEVLVRFHQAE